MRREEMEVDFLAPFLAQMGDPERLTRDQALLLKEQCLADLKQRLIDKANLIQARFEKVRYSTIDSVASLLFLSLLHCTDILSYLTNDNK